MPHFTRRALLWTGIVLIVSSTGIAGFAACGLIPFHSQPSRVARIGFMGSSLTNLALREQVDAFRAGLRDAGWVEGQNLTIDYRWVEDHPEREPSAAAELVALKPDAIVCTTPNEARAVVQASDTIPIVIAAVNDPVGAGLIASLARPGGNITGTSRSVGVGQGAKWFSLLRELLPGLLRVAYLFEPAEPGAVGNLHEIQDAARLAAVDVEPVAVASADNLSDALNSSLAGRPEALITGGGVILSFNRPAIIDFAYRHHLPSIGYVRTWAEQGGLMSYGPDANAVYRRAGAYYVDRILRGAKPADLPVEQPTVLELVANRSTAQELGITIPPDIAAQVTEWIQ